MEVVINRKFTVESTYGLIRIISLDSYVKGKLVEVVVQNHTNFSGTNGAGKTTLLKLLPFFYGATPGQLIQPIGMKKSFVDLFLPRASSLIIYEYTNYRGPKCVVIYRHATGDKPAYRFLDERFSPELFSEFRDGESKFIEGRALGRHWTLHKVAHSLQLEQVSEYRCVIQGDRALLQSSNKRKELSSLVSQYSLPGKLNVMSFMDRMTSAILDRNADMERMKEMIADILREGGLVLPNVTVNKDIADEIGNLAVLRNLETKKPELLKVVHSGLSHIENSVELDMLYWELTAARHSITDKISQLDGDISRLEAELAKLKSEWSESSEPKLQSQITKIKSEYNEKNNRIDQLHEEKLEWDDQDIQHKADEVKRLGDYEHEAKLAKERLEELEKGIQNIRDDYERRKQDENLRHAHSTRKSENEISRLRELIYEITGVWKEERGRLKDQMQIDVDAVDLEFERPRKELEDKIIEATASSRQIQYTDAEKLAEAQAEDARNKASRKREEAFTGYDIANKARKESERQQSRAEQGWQRAQRTENELRNRCSDLDTQISPPPGSWLACLNERTDEWQSTLGRVVNREVLFKKGLNPQFETANSDTFFGWDIDVSGLEKPEWAVNQEQLEQQRGLLEKEWEKASQHQIATESIFRSASQALDSANTVLGEKERNSHQAKEKLAAAEVDVTAIREENRHNASERREAHIKDLKLLETDKKKLLQTIIDRKATIRAVAEENIQDELSRFTMEEGDLQEKVELEKASLNEKNTAHGDNLESIEMDYKQLRSESNLDEAVFERTNKGHKKAKNKVEETKLYKPVVEAFNLWEKNEWGQLEPLTKAINSLRTSLDQANRRMQEEEDRYTAKAKAFRVLISDNAKNLRLLNQSLSSCNEGLQRVTRPAQIKKPDTYRDHKILISEIEFLSGQQIELRRLINEGVSAAERIIYSGSGNTRLKQAWGKLREEQAAKLHDPNDTNALNMNLTQALGELIEQDIPHIRKGDMHAISNAGDQLYTFYHGLKEVSEAIARQSREISRSIDATMEFSALKDIQIHLNSRLDAQEYWPLLKEFCLRWGEWMSVGGDATPDEKLCDDLLLVSRILNKSNAQSGIESVFDLEIHLTENGNHVVARRQKELEAVSSNGLSYLVLCTIYAGITRMLCRDQSISIHWPVDELATLHPENIPALFAMLNHYNIIMVGGFPATDPALLQHFSQHYEVALGKKVIEIRLPEDRLAKRMREMSDKAQITSGASSL
jgi:hypothetical protein